MPIAYISDGTTVLSNVSLSGLLSASTVSTINGLTTQAITGSTGVLTSTLSVGGALTQTGAATLVSTLSVAGQITATAHLSAASSIAVGAGTAITNAFAGTVSIVTMSIATQASSTTTAQVNSLSTNHFVILHPPAASGISAGLTIDAYCSAASVLTVQFSNVTNGPVVQAGPVNYRLAAFRFSGV